MISNRQIYNNKFFTIIAHIIYQEFLFYKKINLLLIISNKIFISSDPMKDINNFRFKIAEFLNKNL